MWMKLFNLEKSIKSLANYDAKTSQMIINPKQTNMMANKEFLGFQMNLEILYMNFILIVKLYLS